MAACRGRRRVPGGEAAPAEGRYAGHTVSACTVELFALVLRSINLSQTCISTVLFLVWFYTGSGVFWFLRKTRAPPLQAAEPACSCESIESLVLELIAESTQCPKNELDFLRACVSP